MRKVEILGLAVILVLAPVGFLPFFLPSQQDFHQSLDLHLGNSYFDKAVADGDNLFVVDYGDIEVYQLQEGSALYRMGRIYRTAPGLSSIFHTEKYLIVYSRPEQVVQILSKPQDIASTDELGVLLTYRLPENFSFKGFFAWNTSLIVYGSGIILFSIGTFPEKYSDYEPQFFEIREFNSTTLIGTTPEGIVLFPKTDVAERKLYPLSVEPDARMIVNGSKIHLFQGSTHLRYDLTTGSVVHEQFPPISLIIEYESEAFAVAEDQIYRMNEGYTLGEAIRLNIQISQINDYALLGGRLFLTLGFSGMIEVGQENDRQWEILGRWDNLSSNVKFVGYLEREGTGYGYAISEWDSIVYFRTDEETYEQLADYYPFGKEPPYRNLPWPYEIFSVASAGSDLLVSNSSALTIFQISKQGSLDPITSSSEIHGRGISVNGSFFSIANDTHLMLAEYSDGKVSLKSAFPFDNVQDTFFTGTEVFASNGTTILQFEVKGSQLRPPKVVSEVNLLQEISDIYVIRGTIVLTGTGGIIEVHSISDGTLVATAGENKTGNRILVVPEIAFFVAGSDGIYGFPLQGYPTLTPTVYDRLVFRDFSTLENSRRFIGASGGKAEIITFEKEVSYFRGQKIFFFYFPIALTAPVIIIAHSLRSRQKRLISEEIQRINDYFVD